MAENQKDQQGQGNQSGQGNQPRTGTQGNQGNQGNQGSQQRQGSGEGQGNQSGKQTEGTPMPGRETRTPVAGQEDQDKGMNDPSRTQQDKGQTGREGSGSGR